MMACLRDSFYCVYQCMSDAVAVVAFLPFSLFLVSHGLWWWISSSRCPTSTIKKYSSTKNSIPNAMVLFKFSLKIYKYILLLLFDATAKFVNKQMNHGNGGDSEQDGCSWDWQRQWCLCQCLAWEKEKRNKKCFVVFLGFWCSTQSGICTCGCSYITDKSTSYFLNTTSSFTIVYLFVFDFFEFQNRTSCKAQLSFLMCCFALYVWKTTINNSTMSIAAFCRLFWKMQSPIQKNHHCKLLTLV